MPWTLQRDAWIVSAAVEVPFCGSNQPGYLPADYFYSLTKLSGVFGMINTFSSYFEGQKDYFRILLKIIGITYLADISANICRDAGYSSVAGQIEIFGKISILAISSPIILALLEAVYDFL